MNDRTRRRPPSIWMAAVLSMMLVSAAQAVGYQCFDARFTVLESGLDRTVTLLEVDGPDARVPESYAVALPTDERPEIWFVEIDGQPIEPFEDVSGVATFNRPGRARDLWIWDFRARAAMSKVRESLGRPDAASVTVEFRHPAPAGMHARLAERRAFSRSPGIALDTDRDPFERTLAASVQNARAARDMLLAAERRVLVGPIDDIFSRSTRWLRIELSEGGFHRIDYGSLRSALGADVDLIDPDTIRIFGARHRTQPERAEDPTASWTADSHLRERAIRVRASGATFGPSDEIVAYLPGRSGWSDEFDPEAGWLEQDELMTADRIAYWMTWDEAGGIPGDFDGAPLRMDTAASTPVASDRTLTDVRVRSHFEENRFVAFGLARDDWSWRERIQPGESTTFDFALSDVVADSAAWLKIRPIASRAGSSESDFAAEYFLNGASLGGVRTWNYTTQSDQTGRNIPVYRFGSIPLRPGGNSLTVSNRTESPSPRLVVDSFTLHWRRALEVGADPLRWYVPAPEARNETWRYVVTDDQGRLGTALVFDRTDPWSPRLLSGPQIEPDGSRLEFEVDVSEGVARRFTVILDEQLRAPSSLERRRPRLLRDEVTTPAGDPGDGWDMVILYPPVFRDAAEDMRDLRSQVLDGRSAPRVTTVALQDVYDQFGHGTKDPAAIRNYFKFLYEVDRDFSYALMVGDANRDARGVLPSSDPDFCPTWVQDFWPEEGGSNNYAAVPFGRDDWLVCFHDDPLLDFRPFGMQLDLPDAAIGRLPVTSVAEASRLVQRILDYEFDPAPGTWRNRVLLAADDEFAPPNRTGESQHIGEAECVSEIVLPPALDVTKVYLTEYERPTPSAVSKPGARLDFRKRWDEGALVVHYIGHGSPSQMADEVLFRIEDVATLDNGGRLPLFLAFSCDVSIYEDPTTRSMSEQLVLQEEGGAIATIAAAEVTFSNLNEELTEAFYTALYPDPDDPINPARRLTRSQPIGLALLGGKWSAPGVQSSTLAQGNNAKYLVLGDPALRLRSPEESVELGGALSESFRSGQELDLAAALEAVAARNGTWYVEARESADSVQFPLPNERTLPYVLDGAAFFRGTGSFDDSSLDLNVRTPAVMRFGSQGRLRVLMESGENQYVGLAEGVDVIRAPVDSDDSEGPSITLEFAQGARRVQPGSVLVATIEDPSGINTLGTTPANSILYEIGDTGLSTDVTESFALDEGSTTRGTVEVPLREIEAGTYTLRMTASDMLSNGGSSEISFEVVPGGDADIGNHAPVPNPFRTSTRFVVDVVSPSGLPADLEIDIRALDGSPVRTLRMRLDGGGGRAVVEWDGRDRRGDEIANGTYLYIVRARFATEPPVTETSTGRVVLMR